jgi:hypothetical protein
MLIDLDPFLVALYTIVDDLSQQQAVRLKPERPGARPTVADSERLTLALCAQWWGRSERAFLRHARAHWRAYFPRFLSQSAYNRRCRALAEQLVALVPAVAAQLQAATAAYQVLDTVAVPLLRRCRGQRQRLFGAIAAIGRGGSDKEWYYGCKLLVAVTPTGVVTGFVVAPANTEKRWVADALLGWRADPHAAPLQVADLPSPRRPNGRPYVGPTGPRWPPQGAGAPGRGGDLADKGFWGRWWQQHWRHDYGAALTTPKAYPGPAAAPARHQHRRRCQIVETMNGHLIRSFGLHFPGARSPRGLLTRLAAKLAAVNLGHCLNHLFGRPALALATLFVG